MRLCKETLTIGDTREQRAPVVGHHRLLLADGHIGMRAAQKTQQSICGPAKRQNGDAQLHDLWIQHIAARIQFTAQNQAACTACANRLSVRACRRNLRTDMLCTQPAGQFLSNLLRMIEDQDHIVHVVSPCGPRPLPNYF